MNIHISETIWLNESEVCTIEHLAEVSGLSSVELRELIESGVITPVNQDPEHYVFQLDYIVIARKARRLRDDFELNTQGVAVALNLLRRIHELEIELDKLQITHK
jgi:chaperone modulatory protein CbpM